MLNDQCRKCRRAGQKLFLKGERCFSSKCAIVRRAYKPGSQGKKSRRGAGLSEYGKQLGEKQRLRFNYNVSERQFKNYVLAAMKEKGDNRDNLMKKLEMRLDNIVFRLGFAKSRRAARQAVSHRHILVNKKIVSIASCQTKVNDEISIKEKSKNRPLFTDLKFLLKKYEAPDWLFLDREKLEGKIIKEPTALALKDSSGVGMVIEFYSR